MDMRAGFELVTKERRVHVRNPSRLPTVRRLVLGIVLKGEHLEALSDWLITHLFAVLANGLRCLGWEYKREWATIHLHHVGK